MKSIPLQTDSLSPDIFTISAGPDTQVRFYGWFGLFIGMEVVLSLDILELRLNRSSSAKVTRDVASNLFISHPLEKKPRNQGVSPFMTVACAL